METNRKRRLRLRVSPNFSLSFAFDGRPYVAKDTEPYPQYWLSERDRILLSMFSVRRGATVDEAIEGYLRTACMPETANEVRRATRAISALRAAGVIISAGDDTSRYTAKIVDAYVEHRPFPRQLAERIVSEAPISASSEVLDLAGGPGDLAIALARVSRRVSMLELSRGFLNAARRRARNAGLELTPILDSCNRLVYRDEQYDAVTISQALHWMDDVMVCRGICRCLRRDGSFFVVHGGFDVADDHPLAHVLGAGSILGPRPAQSFGAQAQALFKRLALLFAALDAPDVHRVDASQPRSNDGRRAVRIVPKSLTLYRQRRPMGLGFLRALLTPAHIEVTGLSEAAFWRDAHERCKNTTDARLSGTYHWALLQFRRDGQPGAEQVSGNLEPIDISYEAPVAVAGA